jgi:hypothetical protein
MEFDLSKGIIKNLAKPTFPINISSSTNKIFIKYSDNQRRRNNIDLIYNLCKNSNFKNKESLLYQTLIFHDIILYNCGNNNIIKDIDLMILTIFFISIKSIGRQITMITIEELKKLNSNKYSRYKNEEIVEMEILCLKLLKYNINIITCYDCLKIIMLNNSVNDDFSESAKDLLQKTIFGDIKDYIFKLPYNLALEVFEKTKMKIKPKLKNKILYTEKKENKNSILYSNDKTKLLKSYLLHSQKKLLNNNYKFISLMNSSDFSTIQNSSSINSISVYQKKINSITNSPKSGNKKINTSKSIIIGKQMQVFENKKKENHSNSTKNIKNIYFQNKNLNEKNEKKENTINVDSLGKGQFNLDFKSLALISKRFKINTLKKTSDPNSFIG